MKKSPADILSSPEYKRAHPRLQVIIRAAVGMVMAPAEKKQIAESKLLEQLTK